MGNVYGKEGEYGLQEDGSYIHIDREMNPRSCCILCKHLKSILYFSCEAFDEIPSKFIKGEAVHDSVIEGQKDAFVFESVF